VRDAAPPVIGIDIFTDADQYAKDYQGLATEMSNSRPTIIWAAAASHPRDYAPGFVHWLMGREDKIVADPMPVLGFEALSIQRPPPVLWALPLFPRDDDGTIRRLPLTLTVARDIDQPESGECRRTFARAVAAEYCAFLRTIDAGVCPAPSGDEIVIPYGIAAPDEFRAGRFDEFFSCDQPPDSHVRASTIKYNKPEDREKLKHIVKNRAVLIGGNLSAVDVHDSPNGTISGLRVNAYAVEAQIHDPAFYAVNQPWAFILDVGLALMFLFVARGIKESERLTNLTSRNFLLLFGGFVLCTLVFIAIAFVMFWKWQYVPALAGVLIGVLLHQSIHAHTSESRP